MQINEAEQNRLILANRALVDPIAAQYRGMKSIPFDDFLSQGMLGLVLAARRFDPELCETSFVDWAQKNIDWEIKRLLREWQPVIAMEDAVLDGEDERGRFYEWTCWQYAAPYEAWDCLAASPEEIKLLFEQASRRQEAFNSAMISLEPRTRKMIRARFFRDPPQTFESIARENKISYSTAVEIISTALKNIKKQVFAYERNRRRERNSNVINFESKRIEAGKNQAAV